MARFRAPPQASGRSADDTPADGAERAVEAARQWNRDLRYTVRVAKDHARALSDTRARGGPVAPRPPR
jgi:hypothetical protein